VSEDLISVIRGVGANNIILCDDYNWGQAGGSVSGSAVCAAGAQVEAYDPMHSIVFSLHMYDAWSGGDVNLNAYIDSCQSQNIPVIVGEYGCNGTINAATTATMFNVCDPRGIGHLSWMWNDTSFPTTTDTAAKFPGAGYTINDTTGAKPTNLNWFGSLIWDDNHNQLALPVTTPAVPLLMDGDFESLPLSDYWPSILDGSTSTVYLVPSGTDSTAPFDGDWSLAVNSQAVTWGDPGTYAGGLLQGTILEPNTTYTLTGWGMTPNGAQGNIIVQYYSSTSPDEIKQILEYDSAEWTQKSLTFTTPSDINGATIVVYNGPAVTPGSTVFYADDITLTVDENPPAPTLTGMTVTAQPKLNYTELDKLDLSALSVELTYSDGGTKTVAAADFAANGISLAYSDGRTAADGDVLTVALDNGLWLVASCGDFSAETGALTVTANAAYDVNGDGKVDSADLALIMANLNKKASTNAITKKCDVDNSGMVDMADYAAVAAYIAALAAAAQ
ncbi:MAG: cellulase family glycosylhydrolase, partial [Defluviitaleaceae bacterium]|nr:cellulase family glycosylhydrolase [Defluviitaleaceae bacterium]